MKLTVDGMEISLREGATLGDALNEAGAVHEAGTVVGIVKGRGEKSRVTNSYWLQTSAGKMRIEITDPSYQQLWIQCVEALNANGLSARWSTAGAVAFGPFPSDITPGRESHEYDRLEVSFGAAGFEAEKSQIIFAKRRHSGVYGVPTQSRGVFARIVGGKNVLQRLNQESRIIQATPIVEWEDITEKIATDDMSLPLQDGVEVYTSFVVELNKGAPHGAEFFLAAARNDILRIDSITSSYLASDILLRERIDFENREPRLEGSVTVRTSGRGLGRVFIYKGDRTSNQAHSVVGRVTKGMDLIKLATPGSRLSAKIVPERFMVMGYPLSKALEMAKSRSISAHVEGYEGEDAVVIEQNPGTTMEVLSERVVNLKATPAHRLVSIELDDAAAPKSLDYFRHVVGLKERPVGPLPVFFVYENTVLFKPAIDAVSYKELLPENKPTGPVPAGSIAVSNQVAKKTGLVGVKLTVDKRYGPSGEKFEATNLIGRVLDLDKLKDVKEGDTVYLLEVRK